MLMQIYPASISMVSSLGAVLFDALSLSWGKLQTQVRSPPCCRVVQSAQTLKDS